MREFTIQRTLRLRESTAAALERIDETSVNAFIERVVRQELRRLGLLKPQGGHGGQVEEIERLTQEVRRLREDLEELRTRTR